VAKAKSDGKMERVAEGVYKRNGSYLVAVWDPGRGAGGGKEWHSPKCGLACRHDEIVDLPSAKRVKRQLEEGKRQRRGRGTETVAGWADRWLTVFPRLKESTNIHNEERIRTFVKDFGDLPLSALDREHLRLWVLGAEDGVDGRLAGAAKGWSGSTVLPDGRVKVKSHIGSAKEVRAMLNDAKKVNLIEANPIDDLRIARGRGRSDIEVLTIAELDKLCEIAERQHGEFGPFFSAMIRFAAWSGMRPGELYMLAFAANDEYPRVNVIDRSARVIHCDWAWNSKTSRIERPKYESIRKIILLPEAERALAGMSWPPSGPILRTQRGGHFTSRNHHYYWNPVRNAFAETLPASHWLRQRLDEKGQAGDLDFYELRHFFGTRLAQPPGDIRPATPYEIAQQMGHKDGGQLAMTRYLHINASDARDALLDAWTATA
jgi:integrase